METNKNKCSRILISSLFFGFILISIFIGIELLNPMPDISTPLDGTLTDVQNKCLDLVIDSTKIFMNWSIPLMGVIAYFIKGAFEKHMRLSKRSIFFCVITVVFLLVSLFFGHLIIEYVIEMLSFDIFNPVDTVLVWYVRFHYCSFLLSLVFLAVSIACLYFETPKEN